MCIKKASIHLYMCNFVHVMCNYNFKHPVKFCTLCVMVIFAILLRDYLGCKFALFCWEEICVANLRYFVQRKFVLQVFALFCFGTTLAEKCIPDMTVFLNLTTAQKSDVYPYPILPFLFWLWKCEQNQNRQLSSLPPSLRNSMNKRIKKKYSNKYIYQILPIQETYRHLDVPEMEWTKPWNLSSFQCQEMKSTKSWNLSSFRCPRDWVHETMKPWNLHKFPAVHRCR